MWSRWVWVRIMWETDRGSKGGSDQLRWRRALSPWNIPLSIRIRSPPASSRNCEPVTVCAAPRKVRRANSALEQLSQHGLEDAAVAVVVHLHRGVEPGDGGEGPAAAVRALHLDRDV